MLVLIRADVTPESGTGHVMRCAALGLRLQVRGGEIHFICAALPEAFLEWLETQGMRVHMLPTASGGDTHADSEQSAAIARKLGVVDLLVVDHYALGKEWERGMRAHVHRILVIDDLADRNHDCDVLLDQNLRKDAASRYATRVPASARQFIGPRFALLRQEFDNSALLRQRDGVLRQLLVFFGGTDPGNQSLKAVTALKMLGDKAPQTTLVLGAAHTQRDLIEAQSVGLKCLSVLGFTDRMSALMSEADLAIGTCGVAAWERCAVGLPSIVVVTAENQREDAEILHDMGAVEHLGDANAVGAERLASALLAIQKDPSRLLAMGSASEAVVAGRMKALAELESALLDV